MPALCEPDRDEERDRRGGEYEHERFLDPAEAAQVDGGDRADRLRGLPADVADADAVGACRQPDAMRERLRITVGSDEDHVWTRLVRQLPEVADVGDHERVLRRGGELLHDPDDVEGRDPEAACRVVEDPQTQQISRPERVVADRLLRDEDAFRVVAEPVEACGGGAAEEVRIAQGRRVPEGDGIDPEGVLQVGTDIRIRVLDRRDAGRAGERGNALDEPILLDRRRRRSRDDVRAERQLSIHARLLVVGRDEDAEADAESEQEREQEQAAVDRLPAPPGAREQEAGRGRRPSARDTARQPGDHAAPKPQQEQCRADPEQGRCEEHVDRERERRVRIGIDDGRESGPGGQPVDESGNGEREQVEVEALPERTSVASHAAPRVSDAAAEGDEGRADPGGRRPDGGKRDADAERGRDAAPADPAPRAREPDRAQRDDRAEGAGEQTEQDALDCRERDEVAAAGAARPQQCEGAAVAVGRPERGEVSQAERREGAGQCEHDVQRLEVERVAGCRVEAVREVVDEDDLARKRPLDAIAELRRLLQCMGGAAAERSRAELRLYLPLGPGL